MSEYSVMISPEIFAQVEPILIIGRIFGLCPISYTKIGKGYLLRRSQFFVLLYTVVAFINVPWTIWGTIDELLYKPAYRSLRMTDPKRRYITCMDLYSIILPGFYVMFVAPVKLKHFCRILQIFQEIDLVVPPKSYKKDRKGFLKVISAMLLFLTFIMAHEIVMWARIKLLTRDLIHYMPFHFTYYVLLAYKLQYWVMVGMVTARIKEINERLSNMYNCGKDISSRYQNIQDIIKAEDKIREVVNEINNWFGLGIGMTIFSSFLHLVLTLYFMLEQNEWTTLVTIYIQVVWVVTHVIRLSAIVEACQKCLDENKRTVKLTIKLLIQERDEIAKKRVKVLLIKIAQRELKFTAYSVSEIDRSFVSDMFCSIASYLVVLLQFNVE